MNRLPTIIDSRSGDFDLHVLRIDVVADERRGRRIVVCVKNRRAVGIAVFRQDDRGNRIALRIRGNRIVLEVREIRQIAHEMGSSEHAVKRLPRHVQPVNSILDGERHGMIAVSVFDFVRHSTVRHRDLPLIGVHHLDVQGILTIGKIGVIKRGRRIIGGRSHALNRRACSLFRYGLRVQLVHLIGGILALRGSALPLRSLIHLVLERRKCRRGDHACSQRGRQDNVRGAARQVHHRCLLVVRLRFLSHPDSFPRPAPFSTRYAKSDLRDLFCLMGRLAATASKGPSRFMDKPLHKSYLGNLFSTA